MDRCTPKHKNNPANLNCLPFILTNGGSFFLSSLFFGSCGQTGGWKVGWCTAWQPTRSQKYQINAIFSRKQSFWILPFLSFILCQNQLERLSYERLFQTNRKIFAHKSVELELVSLTSKNPNVINSIYLLIVEELVLHYLALYALFWI